MPKILLHTEGLAFFIASTFLYVQTGGSLWLYLVLLLAPDIGILGYATQNNRVGSYIYNLFHTYVFPIALLYAAFIFDEQLLVQIALIWVAHVGMDRLFGYGLKYETHFKDTHMGRV